VATQFLLGRLGPISTYAKYKLGSQRQSPMWLHNFFSFFVVVDFAQFYLQWRYNMTFRWILMAATDYLDKVHDGMCMKVFILRLKN